MTEPDTSTIPPGTDPVTDWLRANKLPVTRQNWLEANYPGGIPGPWTNEHEAELPEPLRLLPEPTDEELADLFDQALKAKEDRYRRAAPWLLR